MKGVQDNKFSHLSKIWMPFREESLLGTPVRTCQSKRKILNDTERKLKMYIVVVVSGL